MPVGFIIFLVLSCFVMGVCSLVCSLHLRSAQFGLQLYIIGGAGGVIE